MEDRLELRTMKEVLDYLNTLHQPTKPKFAGCSIDVVNCRFVFEYPRDDAPLSSVSLHGVGMIVAVVLVPDADIPGYCKCYDAQDHYTGAIRLIRRFHDASAQ